MSKLHQPTLLASLALITILSSSCAISPLDNEGNSSTTIQRSTGNMPAHSNPKDLEDQTLKAVNDYRASKGLPAVVKHPGLQALARGHAANLLRNKANGKSGNVSNHIGWEARATAARYQEGMSSSSENIFWSTSKPTGQTIVNNWSSSASHNKNMLGDWNNAGIGIIAGTNEDIFAVQIFGLADKSYTTNKARFNQH